MKDSKKLSGAQRNKLDIKIRFATKRIGIGWVSPDEINNLGLTEAVRLSMQRAISQLKITQHDEIIVDGNINFLSNIYNTTAIIKADGSIPAVSAASIVAKVARDDYMAGLAQWYPQYGFEKHVGYGTKLHLEALIEHGVTNQHRINYKPIQALLA